MVENKLTSEYLGAETLFENHGRVGIPSFSKRENVCKIGMRLKAFKEEIYLYRKTMRKLRHELEIKEQ